MLDLFLKNGWELRRIKGGHHHFYKDGKRETIAIHNKEMNPVLARKIIDRNGLKSSEERRMIILLLRW
ncbi:toxin HicA [Lachnospiraceae bacterium oral taxon 500]|nr:toxin HicA [Lachnospiraceae bacterium oral taxon 500]